MMVFLTILSVLICLVIAGTAIRLFRHASLVDATPRKKEARPRELPAPRITASSQTREYVDKYFRDRKR